MGLKTLEDVLAKAHFIFLDTNLFIYQLSNHPQYAEYAATVLRRVEAGDCVGLTTTVTLAELLVLPARMERLDALLNYEAYLTNFSNLQVAVIDSTVAREAAVIRAATGLPMPDAIQLAAASVYGVDRVITNDRRWRNHLRYPPVIQLGHFTDDSAQTK